jgi:hypothetical protein
VSGIRKVYILGNTEIGGDAFAGCHNLDTVAITSGYGFSMFNNCDHINKIYYSGSEEDFISAGGKSTTLYEIVDDGQPEPDTTTTDDVLNALLGVNRYA